MKALHPEEFKNIAGGRGFKDAMKKVAHQIGRESARLGGKIQREFDRNVKKSQERMGGDTSNLDMDKAREEDRQTIQAYRDEEH